MKKLCKVIPSYAKKRCTSTLSWKYSKTIESAENTVKSSISGG